MKTKQKKMNMQSETIKNFHSFKIIFIAFPWNHQDPDDDDDDGLLYK